MGASDLHEQASERNAGQTVHGDTRDVDLAERIRNTPDLVLRQFGLRSTRPRRAVMHSLLDAPHSTAGDLLQVLRAQAAVPLGPSGLHGRAVSHQAIYNVLEDLTAAGLVRSIEPAGSPARYELAIDYNHHHLVCRTCKRINDVDCAVGNAPCLVPITRDGFVDIDEAEVIWWGLCTDCAAGAGTRRDAS